VSFFRVFGTYGHNSRKWILGAILQKETKTGGLSLHLPEEIAHLDPVGWLLLHGNRGPGTDQNDEQQVPLHIRAE
jgi:hypothetical protein